jgi:hypothetical protein
MNIDTDSSGELEYTAIGEHTYRVTHTDHYRRDYSGIQISYPYPVVFLNPGYENELPIYIGLCEENKLDVAWLEFHSRYDEDIIRKIHPRSDENFEVFHFKSKKHAMMFKLIIGK